MMPQVRARLYQRTVKHRPQKKGRDRSRKAKEPRDEKSKERLKTLK